MVVGEWLMIILIIDGTVARCENGRNIVVLMDKRNDKRTYWSTRLMLPFIHGNIAS